ncbi:phosphoribulokinase [Archaeoglobus sp.]
MLKEKLIESGKVFIIGIAGDSGSGKTTFANGIKRMFGEDIVSHITLDDYHVYDREMRERLGITPLYPSANNLKLVETHLYMLKKGERIKKPTYDHKTGTFGEWEDFEPTPIVIVEGLHTLYDGIRDYIDFKIFVDPARYIKRLWKIRRDVEERGYNREKVIEEIIRREPDYKRYIDFQKIYADIVIKILPSSIQSTERIKYLVDSREEVYKVRLILKKTDIPLESVSLNIDLSDLVKASERDFSIGFFSDYYYAEKASFIDIDGFLNVEIFKSLFDSLKKEIGDGEIKVEFEYVNAIEFSKLLVCWKLVEVLRHTI